MKRKITFILVLVVLLLVGLHYFIFGFIVPKTASLAVPYKWRMVPLRQNKEINRAFFGTPVRQTDSSDEWTAGTKEKQYVLKVYYIYDTVAASYSIRYQYKKWFSARNYLVDSNTIR